MPQIFRRSLQGSRACGCCGRCATVRSRRCRRRCVRNGACPGMWRSVSTPTTEKAEACGDGVLDTAVAPAALLGCGCTAVAGALLRHWRSRRATANFKILDSVPVPPDATATSMRRWLHRVALAACCCGRAAVAPAQPPRPRPFLKFSIASPYWWTLSQRCHGRRPHCRGSGCAAVALAALLWHWRSRRATASG